MVKLYGFECQNKIAVAIWGWKREVYEKWDIVLVTSADKLVLMRLGFKLIDETEVWYTDVFKAKTKTKKEAKAETQEEATA